MGAGHYKKIRVGAIIQARMGSTRMPGKVLIKLPLSGNETILDHIIRRIPEGIIPIIATSDRIENDIIRQYFSNVFRGEEENVLKRFYDCSSKYKLDHIIRLTGDNPIIDTELLNITLEKHIEANVDYTNTEGLPLGCNFEIFRNSALKKAYLNANSDREKEHVTIFIKENDSFSKQTIKYDKESNLRLTIDYPSDYALLNILFDNLSSNFNIEDVIDFIRKTPWLKEINSNNKQLS